ncbi:hypothetical protein [Paraburkholderia humisilvae]|uniref:Uncharacterized protein n=1 Tax=Paraburkholderia humisilvae TaxID=627669 RepID=A0A6J5D9Z7_9BURK|nr:hypothetical protein [Paraburkholderia humisilvae]CAB3750723.1 hypothetical protein LMG29542_01319 [Paraburkholderia humisilvae]
MNVSNASPQSAGQPSQNDSPHPETGVRSVQSDSGALVTARVDGYHSGTGTISIRARHGSEQASVSFSNGGAPVVHTQSRQIGPIFRGNDGRLYEQTGEERYLPYPGYSGHLQYRSTFEPLPRNQTIASDSGALKIQSDRPGRFGDIRVQDKTGDQLAQISLLPGRDGDVAVNDVNHSLVWIRADANEILRLPSN